MTADDRVQATAAAAKASIAVAVAERRQVRAERLAGLMASTPSAAPAGVIPAGTTSWPGPVVYDSAALAAHEREAQRPDQSPSADPPTPAGPPPASALPDGVVLVAAEELARLHDQAELPERIAAERGRRDREQRVLAAVRDGRILPRDHAGWLTALKADPDAHATLDALPRAHAHLYEEIGYTIDPTGDNRALTAWPWP